MSDYNEHLISMAGGDGDLRAHQASIQSDGEALTRAILTRRRIKCAALGNHTEGGCGRCGQ